LQWQTITSISSLVPHRPPEDSILKMKFIII